MSTASSTKRRATSTPGGNSNLQDPRPDSAIDDERRLAAQLCNAIAVDRQAPQASNRLFLFKACSSRSDTDGVY